MIYFTSDNHFYHSNVIKYCTRPFLTVEEMNEKMVAIWNSIVMPEDTVYHLGDFSMAFRSIELYTKRLNGHKILVCGNHDFVHTAHKKSRTPENKAIWVKKYLDNGWAEVHQELDLNIPGVANVRLCHLPYLELNTEQDQRHASHRPKDDGRVLLCGHVHQHWQSRKTSKGTLMINVGVDVWNFEPVSIDVISSIITNTALNS